MRVQDAQAGRPVVRPSALVMALVMLFHPRRW